MANRLFKTPLRALDASGDGISGAKVYLYETGTTTPVTAYTDSGAGTPHPTPLIADGGGTFAELFVSSSDGVKVDLTDATGTSLDGYPVDPVYPESDATTGAANVTFSPTTDIPETDVQAALETVDTRIGALEGVEVVVAAVYTTAGTTTAYTISVTDVSSYTANDRYWIRIDQTNTGAATLNVESAGAKDIYKYDSSGAAAAVVASDLVIGSEYLVNYNGTQFVVISERFARAADSIWETGTATVQYVPTPANIKAAVETIGGMKFIDSWTHSSDVGFVDFTDLGDYTHLLVTMVGLSVSNSSAYARIRTSEDNGASFHGDGGSLVYAGTFVESASTGIDVASSGVNMSGDTTSARSSICNIFAFNTASAPTFFKGSGAFSSQAEIFHAYHTTNTACDAIRISTHPGEAATYDFTAGSIYLMGVKG